MKLSKPQQVMFRLLTKAPQNVERDFPGIHRPFQTACALAKRGVAVVAPPPFSAIAGWSIALSADWLRLEHLENVLNNVEGTPAEHTAANKAREIELESLYTKLR